MEQTTQGDAKRRDESASAVPAVVTASDACRPSSTDEADLRAATEDIKAGRVVDLTPEELAEWEATGELPASVAGRLEAFG